MRNKVVICLVCGLILCAVRRVAATELVSGIFGYSSLTLLGNSDTIVSIPFARLAEAEVTVASAAGSVVTVQESVDWTAGQFVYAAGVQSNTYYLRINSGALEGRSYAITNNTTNTLVVDLKGDTLAALTAGTPVSVVPYWTLSTVFVNGNGIHLTTNAGFRNTEVLIPNVGGAGINLSAASTYYYFTNAGVANWYKVSSGTVRNDDLLLPNTYLIIRHKVATNTTFTSYGDVILTKVTIPLAGNPTNKQDNPVAMPRPVSLTLNDTALIASGAFTPTVNPGLRTDELLVFDNSTTNFNKSSAATYYYYNSTWLKVGSGANFGSSNVFAPGAGFIIRKASGSSALLWTNTPTYTNN